MSKKIEHLFDLLLWLLVVIIFSPLYIISVIIDRIRDR